MLKHRIFFITVAEYLWLYVYVLLHVRMYAKQLVYTQSSASIQRLPKVETLLADIPRWCVCVLMNAKKMQIQLQYTSYWYKHVDWLNSWKMLFVRLHVCVCFGLCSLKSPFIVLGAVVNFVVVCEQCRTQAWNWRRPTQTYRFWRNQFDIMRIRAQSNLRAMQPAKCVGKNTHLVIGNIKDHT